MTMSGLPWHSMKPIPYSSIVGGGMMLLNKDGACVGQVAVLAASEPREMTEAVNRQLLSASAMLEALSEAKRFVEYFAGETNNTFVGPGTPKTCLAQIKTAIALAKQAGEKE